MSGISLNIDFTCRKQYQNIIDFGYTYDKETIQKLLDFFTEQEEYEKCVILIKLLKK